jgi:hypothetical protein
MRTIPVPHDGSRTVFVPIDRGGIDPLSEGVYLNRTSLADGGSCIHHNIPSVDSAEINWGIDSAPVDGAHLARHILHLYAQFHGAGNPPAGVSTELVFEFYQQFLRSMPEGGGFLVAQDIHIWVVRNLFRGEPPAALPCAGCKKISSWSLPGTGDVICLNCSNNARHR